MYRMSGIRVLSHQIASIFLSVWIKICMHALQITHLILTYFQSKIINILLYSIPKQLKHILLHQTLPMLFKINQNIEYHFL